MKRKIDQNRLVSIEIFSWYKMLGVAMLFLLVSLNSFGQSATADKEKRLNALIECHTYFQNSLTVAQLVVVDNEIVQLKNALGVTGSSNPAPVSIYVANHPNTEIVLEFIKTEARLAYPAFYLLTDAQKNDLTLRLSDLSNAIATL